MLTLRDIVKFVKDRLDEDEQTARAVGDESWKVSAERDCVIAEAGRLMAECYPSPIDPCNEATARHMARQDPARTLRRVAAYRAILAAVEKWHDPHPGQPCTNEDNMWVECELHVAATGRVNPNVLPLLAAEWSDHPDYDPTWSVDRG